MSTTVGVARACTRGFGIEGTWATIRVDGNRFRVSEGVGDGSALPTLTQWVLPAFFDFHVHLGLVDRKRLTTSGLGGVLDLGWDPYLLQHWASERTFPEIFYAGAFLTAPGGYPSDRDWAPTSAIVEIARSADAATAVDRMADSGASVIKVCSNSLAGPVLRDDIFAALVMHAERRGLPVVAHAEGTGEAMRATRAGVTALAHAPFSEELEEHDLDEMIQRGLTWISTLDIHGWGAETEAAAIATENVRRFARRGGRVRYGTDLGNGPLPLGMNHRELAALASAGLDSSSILRTLLPASVRRDPHVLNLVSADGGVGPNDLFLLPNHVVISPSDLEAYIK